MYTYLNTSVTYTLVQNTVHVTIVKEHPRVVMSHGTSNGTVVIATVTMIASYTVAAP